MLGLLPPCPVHTLTGLLCPGCGGTHCLLALFHADLSGAWHHNPLLTLLLPAAAALFLAHLVFTALGRHSPSARLLDSRATLWTLTGTTVLFTIARNLHS